jgi:hypothetical protein
MRVLVACEFSGTVRDAFSALGHEAWSSDLLPTEKPGNHYQGSVLDILHEGWDLLIAHPPCTYISNAGAKHLYKGGEGKVNIKRLHEGLDAIAFFNKLYSADIPKICVENPIPSTVYYNYGLPKYHQTIQPFEHGHPFQKKTCLWLKNLPPLQPTKIVLERENTRLAGNWFNKGGKDRQKNRAVTFQGIADAMAAQWGGYVEEERLFA